MISQPEHLNALNRFDFSGFDEEDNYLDRMQEQAEQEFLRTNSTHHRTPRLYDES
jgi:hypothetical protein